MVSLSLNFFQECTHFSIGVFTHYPSPAAPAVGVGGGAASICLPELERLTISLTAMLLRLAGCANNLHS